MSHYLVLNEVNGLPLVHYFSERMEMGCRSLLQLIFFFFFFFMRTTPYRHVKNLRADNQGKEISSLLEMKWNWMCSERWQLGSSTSRERDHRWRVNSQKDVQYLVDRYPFCILRVLKFPHSEINRKILERAERWGARGGAGFCDASADGWDGAR